MNSFKFTHCFLSKQSKRSLSFICNFPFKPNNMEMAIQLFKPFVKVWRTLVPWDKSAYSSSFIKASLRPRLIEFWAFHIVLPWKSSVYPLWVNISWSKNYSWTSYFIWARPVAHGFNFFLSKVQRKHQTTTSVSVVRGNQYFETIARLTFRNSATDQWCL